MASDLARVRIILHGYEDLRALRMPVARTDIASGLMASKRCRQTSYRNSGSRTNCNSRDACVSRNWASRNSPSGSSSKSCDVFLVGLDRGYDSRSNKRSFSIPSTRIPKFRGNNAGLVPKTHLINQNTEKRLNESRIGHR